MEMIYGELEAVIHACGAGIFLRGIYGLVRMKRSLVSTGKVLRAVEDLLYWFFATGVLFVLWQEYFQGIPRVYGFLAVIAGMVLCYKGPEALIYKVFVKYVADPLKKRIKLIKLKTEKRKKEGKTNEPQDKSA